MIYTVRLCFIVDQQFMICVDVALCYIICYFPCDVKTGWFGITNLMFCGNIGNRILSYIDL